MTLYASPLMFLEAKAAFKATFSTIDSKYSRGTLIRMLSTSIIISVVVVVVLYHRC